MVTLSEAVPTSSVAEIRPATQSLGVVQPPRAVGVLSRTPVGADADERDGAGGGQFLQDRRILIPCARIVPRFEHGFFAERGCRLGVDEVWCPCDIAAAVAHEDGALHHGQKRLDPLPQPILNLPRLACSPRLGCLAPPARHRRQLTRRHSRSRHKLTLFPVLSRARGRQEEAFGMRSALLGLFEVAEALVRGCQLLHDLGLVLPIAHVGEGVRGGAQ